MADNTLLSASTGTGDVIRTVHKSTYKTPVSLIDVGGTSTGSEAILGDSTHALPVKIMAGSTSLSVSGSTINVNVVSVSGTTSQAVTLTTASTLSVNVSNTVGVSFTTASTAHVDTELPAAAALADNTANPTVPAVASFPHVWDSTGWDRWPGSSALGGKVYTTTDSTIHATISALTTASTIHIAPLTTNSTINIAALTTASTIHIAPLTTSSTISVTNAAADDAVFTPGTGIGTPMMGLVTSDTVSTGDVGVLTMTLNRQLKVTLFDSTGVEVTSLGGGTQYTIGTSGSTGNTVTLAGAIRRDAAATLADTTQDITALQVDSAGRLWTNNSGSTVSVSGSTISATHSAVDDAVFTAGSGIGVPMMGFASADGVTTGDIGVLAMTTNRSLKATLYDSTGGELLAVSTLSVTNNSTFPVQVTAWSAGSIDVSGSTVGINCAVEDDSVFTPSTSLGIPMMGLVTSDEVSTGDIGVFAMLANRQQKVTLYNSTGVELAIGTGVSVFNKVGTTVVETTAIKTSGGQVYGISGYNNTLAPIYVKLYNTTAAPTTSLTAVARYILPCSTVTGAAGFVEDYACPIAFSTGIGIRITGGSILDGATEAAASTASLYTVNVRYS
jgi:hypothetical protein